MRAVYFGLYDTVRGMYEKGDGLEKRKLNFFASFLLAEGVTVCASYLTYPWDTVRRRMMIKVLLSNFVLHFILEVRLVRCASIIFQQSDLKSIEIVSLFNCTPYRAN